MASWLKDKWDGLFEFEVPADGKKAKNAVKLATLYWTLVLVLLGAFTFQILSTKDHYELGTPIRKSVCKLWINIYCIELAVGRH
jgi:hypothetical protein